MKVLVTGSTGYIGSAVVRKLIAAGHDVTAVVRSGPSARKAADAGAVAVIGDLFNAPWLTAELLVHDGAIHVAAPDDETAPQLNGVVIDAAIAAFGGTDKPFVLTGGVWSYGANTNITESSPATPAEISAWRGELEQRLLDSGVKSSVIQPGIVYGHGAGIAGLIVDAPRNDDGALVLVGSTGHPSTSRIWPISTSRSSCTQRAAATSGSAATTPRSASSARRSSAPTAPSSPKRTKPHADASAKPSPMRSFSTRSRRARRRVRPSTGCPHSLRSSRNSPRAIAETIPHD